MVFLKPVLSIATRLNNIYLKAVKNQTVDVLHYTILLKHILQKKYPSWDVDRPFLLLVPAITMYCLILRIMFSQIVQVLCNKF